MNAEVIDIGQYVKLPYDVVIAKISNRAFRVWTLVAAGASPENPIAQVRQSTLAEQLGCSTDTIRRAIAELVQYKLLCEAGKWNQGRCKTYRLNWGSRPKEECAAATKGVDELLVTYGERWAQAYACFDGASGRPSLRECIEEALKHSSKGTDLKVFIDGWLHIASRSWSEQKAAPPAEAVMQPTGSDAESDEEREWIIAQIKSDNEIQRRKEALEARRLASFGRAVQPPKQTGEMPICRENYPISWSFHQLRWAGLRRNVAA